MKERLTGVRAGRVVWTRSWEAGLIVALAAGCAETSPGSTISMVRIGVLDTQQVLEQTTVGKEAKNSINTFMKNRQALIELDEKELRRMEEAVVKQSSVLSARARQERENEFRRRMMDYQQKASKLNREVAEKQNEVFQEFREKVRRAATKIAREKGLLAVFEAGAGTSTIYHEASLDITGAVIMELERKGQ